MIREKLVTPMMLLELSAHSGLMAAGLWWGLRVLKPAGWSSEFSGPPAPTPLRPSTPSTPKPRAAIAHAPIIRAVVYYWWYTPLGKRRFANANSRQLLGDWLVSTGNGALVSADVQVRCRSDMHFLLGTARSTDFMSEVSYTMRLKRWTAKVTPVALKIVPQERARWLDGWAIMKVLG